MRRARAGPLRAGASKEASQLLPRTGRTVPSRPEEKGSKPDREGHAPAPAAPLVRHFPLALPLVRAPAQVRPHGEPALWVHLVWESSVFGRKKSKPRLRGGDGDCLERLTATHVRIHLNWLINHTVRRTVCYRGMSILPGLNCLGVARFSLVSDILPKPCLNESW